MQRGRFATTEPTSPFIIEDAYFGLKRFEGTEERDCLGERGTRNHVVREPVPDDDGKWNRMQRWSRIPLFLWLKARPLALSAGL